MPEGSSFTDWCGPPSPQPMHNLEESARFELAVPVARTLPLSRRTPYDLSANSPHLAVAEGVEPPSPEGTVRFERAGLAIAQRYHWR